MADPVLSRTDARGVATVTLNRPAVNNAYNGEMIAALSDAMARLAADPAVRAIVLRGNGRHFQAGADLAFLQDAAAMPESENLEISRLTVATVTALQRSPKPTLALVHGGCFGGGVGMVAACDMAIAAEDAVFSLAEVRWGVIPAPILPVLVAKAGLGAVTRYALTGERFGAAVALRLGLVQEVCAGADRLDEAAAPMLEHLLMAAPDALAATKRLGLELAGAVPAPEVLERLAQEAAERRRSEEAAEGLASFFEKRKPNWYPAAD